MDTIVKLSVATLIIAVGATYFLPDAANHIAQNQEEKTRAPLKVENRQAQPTAAYSRQDDFTSPRAVRISAGQGGHFYFDAKVNGADTPFVVDTGASLVALSYDHAQRAGFSLRPSDFTQRVNTANGVAKVAPIVISEIRYQHIRIKNVRAFVTERGALGNINLLGNSFLSQLKEYTVAGGELIMIP